MEHFANNSFKFLEIDINKHKKFIVAVENTDTGGGIRKGDILEIHQTFNDDYHGRFKTEDGRIIGVYWRDLYYYDETKPVNLMDKILGGKKRQ